MASLQHVYRRGHIFWWRRVHRISGGRPLDIRISLRTSDRSTARNWGAALAGATGGVLIMLNEKIRAVGAVPAEDELQAMARSLYEELLADLCSQQRAAPCDAEMHSAANLAFVDYYQRLTNLGGHMSLLPAEELRLATELGWDEQRLADLRAIIRLREEKGITQLQPQALDRELRLRGYEPTDRLRWMLELAVYPHYRDAHIEAEVALQEAIAPIEDVQQPAGSCAPPVRLDTAATEGASGPLLSDFVEQAITDLVVEEIWDIKSARQARSSAALFELLVGQKPFETYTQADFACFKRRVAYLPGRYDMGSDKSRTALLQRIAAFEADDSLQKDKSQHLSARTRNRHISSLKGLHRWARKTGMVVPSIKFDDLVIPVSKAKRARSLRPATPTDDVGKLFALPVFTGCQLHTGGTGQKVLSARFTPGGAIVHDAFYWCPLLLHYTGARREELCKLRPRDIKIENGIAFIWIDFTETGRIKNDHSVRPVPLHGELIRLGFLDFVHECGKRGYDVLFPELRPTNAVQGFGDVYFKNVWAHLKARARLTGDATVHGMRHRFSTDLKTQKVFSEFRQDVMGHAGANINEERYSDAGPLAELLAVVEQLPSVTAHLVSAPMQLPPPAVRIAQPAKSRKGRAE